MNILLFGAGSTGRGHLNALLFENGYRNIVLVDKDSNLVNALKKNNKYCLHLLGPRERTIEITDFKIYNRTQETKIIESFLTSDLVLTAVIAENLTDVSKIIAKAISERYKLGIKSNMNIMACENLENATSYLKKCTYSYLSDSEKEYCNGSVGFPDAMISRVVPLANDNPLNMIAEDYNEWVVRKPAFLGVDPQFPFMTLTDKMEAFLEKKLWIHNGGHATVAYAGLIKGYTYIHEAVSDPDIGQLVTKVLDEIGEVVKLKHGFPDNEIDRYKKDLGARGAIAEMKDELLRVVRDPIRKLGTHDRLLAPALYAENNGLSNTYTIRSIQNIFKYKNPNDPEAVTMQRIIADKGLRYFLDQTIGLKAEKRFVDKIVDF